MLKNYVYWIHHKDHTDVANQGYVGVTSNTKSRWLKHSKCFTNPHIANAIKKYGWENLKKDIILIAEEQYCYEIEKNLRPTVDIGWNVAIGGKKPPSWTGKKHKESTIQKMSNSSWMLKNPGVFVKENHPAFKGRIIAINRSTNQQKILVGRKELENFGFIASKVYACLLGKRLSHKNNTFKREA